MKDILRWNDSSIHAHDIKKSKNVLKYMGPYNRFKYRINKTDNLYVTE